MITPPSALKIRALAHWDGIWLDEVRQSLTWLLAWVDPHATDWVKLGLPGAA